MDKQIYWMVIASNGDYALHTIDYQRKMAIKNWIDGTTLDWKKDSKKYGWKVVKIQLKIKII